MKKTLSFILIVMVLMFCLSFGAFAADPWDGSVDTDWYTNAATGTTNFEIDTPAKLAGLASIVNAGTDYFAGKTITLTANLDLGGIYTDDGWDDTNSQKWTPIGSSAYLPFFGVFDGAGHSISNLYINSEKDYQGLFCCNSGKIKNLSITSGSVTAGSRTGAIASYNMNGIIINCVNTTSINGTGFSGGITGTNVGGYIMNCSNSGNITVTSNRSGGIAGTNTGSILYSVNRGAVSSSSDKLGGITGECSGTIKDCYNTGDVSSSVDSAKAYIGGIAGNNTGTIKNAYSTGAVTGMLPGTGAIMGYSKDDYSNLYYLKTATVNNSLYSVGSTTLVISDANNTYAKNETDLKDAAADLGSAFTTDTATLNNGYPVLTWEVNGYPADETDTLAIDSVEAVNGTVTITMNKTLDYTNLSLSDLTITATSNGDDITLSGPILVQRNGESAATVTITFTAIEAASSEQAIHISVSYKGTEAKTADYSIGISNEWFVYAAGCFEGGSGTLVDPYQVATAAQLAYLSAQVKAGNNFSGCYFEQTADIDLGSSINGDGDLVGHNWTPIGTSSRATFNGNYNGNGHKISGLAFVSTTKAVGGVFGYANCARIFNVNVDSPVINNGGDVGGLVGYSIDTSVKNCHVTGGTLSTEIYNAGGLIGTVNSTATSADSATEIFGCSSSASVCGRFAGGLVGYCSYGDTAAPNGYVYFENCYSTGTVNSDTCPYAGYIGGLVGEFTTINTVHINYCYASGNITSKDKANVGGIAGYAQLTGNKRVTDIQIANCAALSRKIDYSGSDTVSNYSRIMGNGADGVSSGYVKLKNNDALDIMMINGTMIDSTDANSADGVSMTKEDIALQNTWENLGFDFSDDGAWNWDTETNLPVLNHAMADYAIHIILNPHDAIAYTNKDAIFQVKARNGVGAFTYQWQNSSNGTSWDNMEGATDAVLTIGDDASLNGHQYRCVITDEANQTVTSNAATLTVKGIKYTADSAAANLYKTYQGNGTLHTVREPISLYAYQQDISDFAINLRYYGNYFSSALESNKPRGNLSWAMLDNIAAGGNPREYLKSGETTAETATDLVAEILAGQSDNGKLDSEVAFSNDTVFDSIIYTLSLDIYFDGASTWGNEQEGTSRGRDGAIEYLLSRLQNDSASDGRYFYTTTPFSSIETSDIQRSQGDFVILMSRLVDDDTYGKQAEKAMFGVLAYLGYLYDSDQITSTETMGRYLSALIAAANATDNHLKQNAYYDQADAVYISLQTALALDGTYAAAMNYSKPPATGDADATAAVMMGLSDYVNDNCVLSTMGYTITDEDVLNVDFNAINVPSTTTSDLTLPTNGTYGTTFTWESSAPEVIATDGTVTRAAKDQTVTLTVTGKYGTAESTKTFTVTVPADQSADGDAVDAVMKTLDILPETVSDLTLPTSGENDVTISWATSNSDVITEAGAVTRPALGENDVTVTLTATVAKGEVSKNANFDVLVYAQTEDSLKEGYYEVRSYYLTNRELTSSYWQTFAAYAALGDYIQDPDNGYTFYDITQHKLGQTWQGTDYGAVILQIMAMGENPYDYKGLNYVELAVDNGTGGPYANPVWATMGLEGAGATGYSPAVSYCVGQLNESAMTFGIDISGWALAELSRHLGEPGVDEAIAGFNALMKANQSDKAYFNYHSIGSMMLSTGCVVSGFTALTAEGVDGYDVTKDPWLVNGVNMIDSMYDESKSDTSIGSFGRQLQMEFCDLYNTKYNDGNLMWFSVGVDKDKLDAQIAKANAILADSDEYTKASITTLQSALDTVNAISSERLEADIPDYGKEYYDLYDAVRYAQTIDEPVNDQSAADEVTALINALPDADLVALANQKAVEAVRAAYDGLTDDQKALVAEDTLTRLTGIESALSDLVLSNAKTAAKDALSTALDNYNEDDYTSANWTLLNRAKTDGDTAIDQAATVDDVTSAKETALAAMAAVETKGNDNAFTDVDDDDWFYDDVAFVVEKKIFNGTSTTSFSPDATMTRGMMVTILFRLSGDDAVDTGNTFSDVNSDDYYADAVAWATKNSITAGTGNNHFSPNQAVTREEAVTFLYRYAQYIEADLTGTPEKEITTYSDYDQISSWARESMTWAYNAQIIQGVSDTELNPAGKTTRAQMAAIVHRFIGKLEK